MAIELKIPPAGESITEVTVVEWLKQEGSWAALDETVAVIETDKANVDISAPVAGVVTKITKQAGDEATVGEVIGFMEAQDAPPADKAAATNGATSPVIEKAPAQPSPAAPAPAKQQSLAAVPSSAETDLRVPPSVRRALREGKISPQQAKARSGGSDLLAYDRAEPNAVTLGSRETERVKMTSLRRRIASRLVEAQQTAAILTTFNEVDMTAIMAIRKQYKDVFLERHGVKLGFMSFFIKAVIEGLKDIPQLNASIEDDHIIYRNYYDVGVAVGSGRGLVVPVIRSAERLSFAQLEKTIGDFGVRARDNKIKPDELQGGTFTISNGGVYGSLMSTPILNPPQSGILGMHAIKERPVVRDGQLVAAPMMYLALSYDHRIVDGREAVTFLVRIKDCVENPSRMLLEV